MALSAVYVAFVSAMFAVRGNRPFERLDVPYWQVASSYVVAGLLGGTVVGILRPATRSKWGAKVVGATAGTIAIAPIWAILAGPPSRWNVLHVLVLLIMGVGLGIWVLGPELHKSALGWQPRRSSG